MSSGLPRLVTVLRSVPLGLLKLLVPLVHQILGVLLAHVVFGRQEVHNFVSVRGRFGRSTMCFHTSYRSRQFRILLRQLGQMAGHLLGAGAARRRQ